MAESLVLALDGSTRTCSAALLCRASDALGGPGAGGSGGKRRRPNSQVEAWSVATRRASLDDRGQAKLLLRLVDEMVAELGAEPNDLIAIVVGIGPGTFTGVRIAVATARALALSLSVPVYGVSTLAALAAGAAQGAVLKEQEGAAFLVPVVDARRQQVFYAFYAPGGGPAPSAGARWCRRGEPSVCGKGDLGDAVGEAGGSRILVVGESRGLMGDLPSGWQFATAEVQAEYLVLGQDLIGESLLNEDGTMSRLAGTPESVKPIYVRSPDADVHITKMKDPWADGGNLAHGKG